MIRSNELTAALAIVKKYSKWPGVIANELTRAQQVVKKYADLQVRADCFTAHLEAVS